MGTSDPHRMPPARSSALGPSLTAASYPSRDGMSRWSGHSSATAGDVCERAEHGPMRRLENLAPGTRVRLAPGRIGTLLGVNFTRAIVELDRGEDRRREIAPGCEVDVLTTPTPGARSAAIGSARDEKGPARPEQVAEMRNTDPARPVSPTPPCCASESPPARAGRSACAVCGAATDLRRPWGRYCSAACRQRGVPRATPPRTSRVSPGVRVRARRRARVLAPALVGRA